MKVFGAQALADLPDASAGASGAPARRQFAPLARCCFYFSVSTGACFIKRRSL